MGSFGKEKPTLGGLLCPAAPPVRVLGLHQDPGCSVVPGVWLGPDFPLVAGRGGEKTGHFDVAQGPNDLQDSLAFGPL